MKTINSLIIILLISTSTSIFSSCSKEAKTLTIVALPKHDSTAIYGATAYVFKGIITQPANPTIGYDLKVIGEPAEDHVHLLNMDQGDYYIYVTGYDSIGVVSVFGGLGIKIDSEIVRLSEYDLEISVSS